MHPVDFLARLDAPPRTEAIEAVAICTYGDESKEVTHEIRLPGPPPSLNATPGFEELPDEPFTVWESVKAPDRVTLLSDGNGIRVHVEIKKSIKHLGIPIGDGKFKALYRVFWRE